MNFMNKVRTAVPSEQLEFHLADSIAKIIPSENRQHERGVDVETHCRIVGLVASELLVRMPTPLRESLFPTGAELVAAVHDVGKVNPLFQEKYVVCLYFSMLKLSYSPHPRGFSLQLLLLQNQIPHRAP